MGRILKNFYERINIGERTIEDGIMRIGGILEILYLDY